MNAFDRDILLFLNQFAGHSHGFDNLVSRISETRLLKGAVLMTLLWWVWFRRPRGDGSRFDDTRDAHELVVMTVGAAFIGLALARGMAHVLPYRERPLYVPELHFTPPYGLDQSTLIGWSSFPSDHAVLYAALATGIYLASPLLGVLAYAYVLLIILFPRLYLGFHYPTDVVVGLAIGVGGALVEATPRVRRAIADPVLRLADRWPGLFYAAAFWISFNIVDQFEEIRIFVGTLARSLKG